MAVYLVSDVHLEAGRPRLTELFVQFLRGPARQVRAVYLLGDIFEVWIGDDDPSPLVARVEREIRALVDAGTSVYFMHGNRDFLLGEEFAARAGMTLLADPSVVELGGRATLLSHGDLYCTDDEGYQAFRRTSRDPAWQRKVLGWPLWRRRLTARVARYLSRRSYRRKLAAGIDLELISDVVPSEICRALDVHGVSRIVHGHTHRPAAHVHLTARGQANRIVLADWLEQGEVLLVRDDGAMERQAIA